MARKRQIDPGIWASSQFMSLGPWERLLFIGLISNADDEGRMVAEPTHLRAKIFPGDDVRPGRVKQWRDKLAAVGLIIVYSADTGVHGADTLVYLALPNWHKYQFVNKRYPSVIPAPNSTTSVTPVVEHDVTSTPPIGIGIGNGIGNGNEDGKNPPASSGENIFSLYENLCGSLNPLVVDDLKLAEKQYSAEWIVKAFKEAADLNKRSWRYVSRILERYEKEGIDGKAREYSQKDRAEELAASVGKPLFNKFANGDPSLGKPLPSKF